MRKLLLGMVVFCVLAGAATPSRAAIISETFDTDSADMPTDYPSYLYHPDASWMSVSGGILYVQDRNDGLETSRPDRMTVFLTGPTVSGAMTLDVDLGCQPTQHPNSRISTGVMLGDLSGSYLLFRFHADYTGEGFAISDDDSDIWFNPGWTPATGILPQHLTIAFDGVDTFDVTFSEGTNVFTTQYVDSRLSGATMQVGLFSMNGGGYGTSNFDNLNVTPEPATLGLLILGGLPGVLRRRSRQA
ncbi:MAG: PEP-CTERM sorting domain-containing protein [Phycisphaerae bacterium]|nr:PEP-CTERM sorting domain-containing protein [Phycisphaerae bacterium]